MLDRSPSALRWRSLLLVHSIPPVSQLSLLLMHLMSAGMRNLHLPSYQYSLAMWTKSTMSSSLSLDTLNLNSTLGSVWQPSIQSQRSSNSMILGTLQQAWISSYSSVPPLTSITKHRSDGGPREEWPSSSDISILCDKAAELFIYAATVVKFVVSSHHQPSRRLALLVSLPHSTEGVWY